MVLNQYSFRKFLILSILLTSCDPLNIDPGSTAFIVTNNTNSRVSIEGFVKGSSSDQFTIEPTSSITKFSKNRGGNVSIISNSTDSLVVTKETNGHFFYFYCFGVSLIGSGEKCPEDLGKLPTMYVSETCESVNERASGIKITRKCYAEINESDFQ